MMPNPYHKYQEQSMMTMTHAEMLIKLYDGAIRQIMLADAALADKRLEDANTALQKAQKIVGYLDSTLERKYDVADSLAKLYEYFNYTLMMANIKKDGKELPAIAQMLSELKDTFSQADRMLSQQRSAASAGADAARIG